LQIKELGSALEFSSKESTAFDGTLTEVQDPQSPEYKSSLLSRAQQSWKTLQKAEKNQILSVVFERNACLQLQCVKKALAQELGEKKANEEIKAMMKTSGMFIAGQEKSDGEKLSRALVSGRKWLNLVEKTGPGVMFLLSSKFTQKR